MESGPEARPKKTWLNYGLDHFAADRCRYYLWLELQRQKIVMVGK
jgi:hypothetical protein